jgi:hypothetical protein
MSPGGACLWRSPVPSPNYDQEWKLLWIEDATGVLPVDPGTGVDLTDAGDLLSLRGRSGVRDGLNTILPPLTANGVKRDRQPGQPVRVRDALSGGWDGRRVVVAGTVQVVGMQQSRLRLQLATPSARLVVWVRVGSVSDAASFIDANVRIVGVPLRHTEDAGREGRSELFVDDLTDVIIDQPAPNPLRAPARRVQRLTAATELPTNRVRLSRSTPSGAIATTSSSWTCRCAN